MLSASKLLKRRVWYPARGAARALAWPDGARVDFVVAGAQRSGTTALDSYLRQHPDIEMALLKEPHFFDDERVFRDRKPAYWKYHAMFPAWRESKVFGEVTPIYMYWKPAFSRIARYSKNMRIVMILRNPIERAYSHWNMQVREGDETAPFAEAIRREAEEPEGAIPDTEQRRRFSYINRGFYSEQIERALERFPEEHVLAVRQDEMQADPQSTMSRTFRFLGVGNTRIRAKRVNCGSYETPMRPEDRKLLRDIYADEIRNLERLLGWNCEAWLRL